MSLDDPGIKHLQKINTIFAHISSIPLRKSYIELSWLFYKFLIHFPGILFTVNTPYSKMPFSNFIKMSQNTKGIWYLHVESIKIRVGTIIGKCILCSLDHKIDRYRRIFVYIIFTFFLLQFVIFTFHVHPVVPEILWSKL